MLATHVCIKTIFINQNRWINAAYLSTGKPIMSNAETVNAHSTGGGGGKDVYSYANLCKVHFRPTNVVPQFTRKEPRSPLLRTTPDEELDVRSVASALFLL